MFTRITTFVLAFCLFSSSTMASSQDGLRSAFDEFTYAVSVDWDQQDESFVEARKAELEQAILESGATREDVMAFAKSQIKDATLARDFEKVLNAVSVEKMSIEEAQEHMVQAILKSQSQGAQWIGTVAVIGGVALVSFAVFMIVLITKIPKC